MLTDTLLKSTSSKLVILLGIICVILTAYKYCNLYMVAIQSFIFCWFAWSINCQIYGKCYSAPFIPLIVTGTVTLFLIFDYLGIFDNYKKLVQDAYSTFYDDDCEWHFKKIIFPKEEELSVSYKNRIVPKFINKQFKHTPTEYTLNKNRQNSIKNLKTNIINTSGNLANNIYSKMSIKL